MVELKTDNACSEQGYQVRPSDLPLSCPMPEINAWNAHPRVYLNIESKGQVACPYCGAIYRLVAE